MRRADVTSRTVAVDLLNRSLLSDFLPLQGARGLGLYLLDRIGPLRRAVMREGVGAGSVAAAPDARRGALDSALRTRCPPSFQARSPAVMTVATRSIGPGRPPCGP